MEAIYNEEMIRAELRKLDKISGFKGAELEIKMVNSRGKLGYFSYENKNAPHFGFSTHYFFNENFPVEEKIETIRHEYAHFLDFMIYGVTSPHGTTWKICCNMIGASPSRLYHSKNTKILLEKHEKERNAKKAYDKYQKGVKISHPRYGKGTIKNVTGADLSRSVEILFETVGNKKLDASWLDKNCKIL